MILNEKEGQKIATSPSTMIHERFCDRNYILPNIRERERDKEDEGEKHGKEVEEHTGDFY